MFDVQMSDSLMARGGYHVAHLMHPQDKSIRVHTCLVSGGGAGCYQDLCSSYGVGMIDVMYFISLEINTTGGTVVLCLVQSVGL